MMTTLQQLPLYTFIESTDKRGTIRPVPHYQLQRVVWEMRFEGQVIRNADSYEQAARLLSGWFGLEFPDFDEPTDFECPDNLPLETPVVTVDLEPVKPAKQPCPFHKSIRRVYSIAEQLGYDRSDEAMRVLAGEVLGRSIETRRSLSGGDWDVIGNELERRLRWMDVEQQYQYQQGMVKA